MTTSLFPNYLCNIGHEVVGNALRILSDHPWRVRTHGVEVSAGSKKKWLPKIILNLAKFTLLSRVNPPSVNISVTWAAGIPNLDLPPQRPSWFPPWRTWFSRRGWCNSLQNSFLSEQRRHLNTALMLLTLPVERLDWRMPNVVILKKWPTKGFYGRCLSVWCPLPSPARFCLE